MNVEHLTEHHMEFLSLKGDCASSSESTRVKMPHRWTSHVAAHMVHVPTGFLPHMYKCPKETSILSHQAGLDIFPVWVFIYSHTFCIQAVNALTSPHMWTCAESPEPPLLDDAISTKITCTGLHLQYYTFMFIFIRLIIK